LANYQDALDRLNATIERKIEALNAPGLVIGLTDRDRLLFVGTYGLANRDTQTPVTPETLFQIGSISKAFTSIVLLQLQEQGLLHLDDPVTRHLPWFAVQSACTPITEVLHGPDWFIRAGAMIPKIPANPPEWESYPGHYRSHNPWLTNFRVVLRKGSLFIIHPWYIDEILHPLEPGLFRIGADPRSPEFIRFELILAGKAMRANLSGGAYCRTFTS